MKQETARRLKEKIVRVYRCGHLNDDGLRRRSGGKRVIEDFRAKANAVITVLSRQRIRNGGGGGDRNNFTLFPSISSETLLFIIDILLSITRGDAHKRWLYSINRDRWTFSNERPTPFVYILHFLPFSVAPFYRVNVTSILLTIDTAPRQPISGSFKHRRQLKAQSAKYRGSNLQAVCRDTRVSFTLLPSGKTNNGTGGPRQCPQ